MCIEDYGEETRGVCSDVGLVVPHSEEDGGRRVVVEMGWGRVFGK